MSGDIVALLRAGRPVAFDGTPDTINFRWQFFVPSKGIKTNAQMWSACCTLMGDAADEIERLRDEVERLRKELGGSDDR